MENKQQYSLQALELKLQKVANLIEHLIAVEMYKGGATQPDVAVSLSRSVGKVNKLVKGVKSLKENNGKK